MACLEPTLLDPLMGYQRVALAVSGGPDSMALTALAAEWVRQQSDGRPDIQILCVDHGLRVEARQEAELVMRFASTCGFEARTLKVEWEPDMRPSTQAVFRDARYQAMFAHMARHDINALTLAHHADDQAETVLMRMAHQSGVKGLGGMRAICQRTWGVHHFDLLRPFLGKTKQALLAYCAEENVPFVEDPSNQNADFERVRIRQSSAGLNDIGLTAPRLGLFARRLQQADDALTHYTQQALQAHVRIDHLLRAEVDLDALRQLPSEIGVRLLHTLLDRLGGATKRCDLKQVEVLHAQFVQTQTTEDTTIAGCLVRVNHDKSGVSSLEICREFGRLDIQSHTLSPEEKIQFDGRFEVRNMSDKSLVAAPFGFPGKKWCNAHLPHLERIHLQARAATPCIFEGKKRLQALDFKPFGELVELRTIV